MHSAIHIHHMCTQYLNYKIQIQSKHALTYRICPLFPLQRNSDSVSLLMATCAVVKPLADHAVSGQQDIIRLHC
jgi:hypothetical protein